MNISVCITVLNEQEDIAKLLDSLLNQTRKAGEIVIVDGGSSDKTIEIVNHYQKRYSNIKLLKEKCSRSRGRNLGVEIAKSEIIAMTDAGCVARLDWLKKITEPFKNKEIDVVAGFYHMVGKTPFQKAAAVFLGVTPGKFDYTFLPPTRSIAFKKSIWEKVGGFPENLEGAAEDTVFNYKLIKAGIKLSRVKDAVVEWGMPNDLTEFFEKVKNYAKGDARSKIWIFPKKGFASHNIKAVFVLLRYLIGVILFFLSFNNSLVLLSLLILVTFYIFRSYQKAGLWGIPLQFASDFGVMVGFLRGIYE